MTFILTKEDKEKLFMEFEDYMNRTSLDIPLSVFCKKLSPLETIIKYLIENRKMANAEVAKLLARDRRLVWATYRRAKDKHRSLFRPERSALIPLQIFNSDIPVAESLVKYMKETLGMTNSQIAKAIKRDDRTIWTLYKRSRSDVPSQPLSSKDPVDG